MKLESYSSNWAAMSDATRCEVAMTSEMLGSLRAENTNKVAQVFAVRAT